MSLPVALEFFSRVLKFDTVSLQKLIQFHGGGEAQESPQLRLAQLARAIVLESERFEGCTREVFSVRGDIFGQLQSDRHDESAFSFIVHNAEARRRNVYDIFMCRSIKVLRRPGPVATPEEVSAAALQFVRKVSGYRKPSKARQAVFDDAVRDIAGVTDRLLKNLSSAAPADQQH